MASERDPSKPKAPEFADRLSSMAAAAFLGIAWFICIELNIRLFYRATRRSLYFWSCLLCSWGLVVHGISILLVNFNKWTSYSAIVFIHLSWLRHPRFVARLENANLIWDKVQVAAFFTQESLIGFFYIYQTSMYLQNLQLLGKSRRVTRDNLRSLIAVNVLIIMLDASVLGLCYSGHFFLQGFYKVAVYAVKLRTEFTILNQLRQALADGSTGGSGVAVQTDQRPIVMASPKSNDVVEVVE
ncbi:hypothetical protein BKA58DRAFT_464581 [Alternaria rosae]|uniref:uncharacterized protein n=1 Tax=Alternaria rosae TaxID=1187941 RepID=UPI001E8E4F80|nr:uncharacterized protein BKA58DRAFT_464581 [Alternaria rosae]KAH6882646.1 hypothetical protein BKA58DRAFT_464581 [Alternaria rosae]